MARKTEAVITMEMIDVTAKADSAPAATYNQSFANISLLKQDLEDKNRYMTTELNYNLLSGETPYFPQNPSIPYFSTTLSGSNCKFTTSPAITVSFAASHSSSGITLLFMDDSPSLIKVEWFDAVGAVIESEQYSPDSIEYFCKKQVSNYRKVKLTMQETRYPFRHVKLIGIKYGRSLVCRNNWIKEAEIHEELSPIASELSINTCTYSLSSDDEEFNIMNMDGIYYSLKPEQKIVTREIVNDEVLEMGTFYLDTWESETENQMKLKCVDVMGLFDKTEFKKGRIYEDVKAGMIIGEIMSSAGWSNYIVSEEVLNTRLTGYIPVCSHRQALHQVVFAARAVADTSRSSNIKIYRPVQDVNFSVRNDRIFLDSSLKITSFVSGINVTAHDYIRGAEIETAFEGELSAGIHEIVFSSPYDGLIVEGCTITEGSFNYAIIQVQEDGPCKISGHKYTDRTAIHVYKTEETGEALNEVNVTSATLVSKDNAYLIAKYLLDYYSLRKESKQRIILENEVSGRWTNMQTQSDVFLSGCIEQMTIDLAGGFLANTTVKGNNSVEDDPVYAGKEIYTGERIGVL